jgi:hypothetical protein
VLPRAGPWLLAGASLLWAPGAGLAHAQTPPPLALVLETQGATRPALQAYTELSAGTPVALATGARLVFLHYGTCRAVTVVGGTLTLTPQGYTLAGGTTESETPRPCPRTVRVREGVVGGVGGIVLRGPPRAPLRFPPQPAFVLTGARAGDFASTRITRGGQTLVEGPVEARQFRWPAAAPALASGGELQLWLLPRAPGGAPVTIPFTVGDPPADPAQDAPILIAID